MFNGLKICYMVWKYVIWYENMFLCVRSIASCHVHGGPSPKLFRYKLENNKPKDELTKTSN